ncbi:hypothetical protein [Microbulbifer sp. SAOS-129_SWC]|uniref:hypothetical protein n=1 Tax=Microbulbifer sp. SAOS-129_SWC TaxID=3145235 RepID=UPI0032175F47
MSIWENRYRDAVADIASPGALDEKILQQARQFKPRKQDKRWLSRTASSFTAVAIVVLLVHPAQYLGALTPKLSGAADASSGPLANWNPATAKASTPASDPWFELRSAVHAGNYLQLCQQWRKQQRGDRSERLPRDLETMAREHCRILPSH